MLKAYIIALHQTLTDGYLGTEECIWAIIFARLPHLFAGCVLPTRREVCLCAADDFYRAGILN